MSQIKERPILFSAPMVRAILEGRKTVTRRTMKVQPVLNGNLWQVYGAGWNNGVTSVPAVPGHSLSTKCPYGTPGERLWVREIFACGLCTDQPYAYRATHAPEDLEAGWHDPIKWKPSIHMPRAASRILLEITDVRIERLQDITEDQALAEGIVGVPFRPDDGWPICTGYMVGPDDGKTGLQTTAAKAFAGLWDSVGGDWEANPWVWVVEFKRGTP